MLHPFAKQDNSLNEEDALKGISARYKKYDSTSWFEFTLFQPFPHLLAASFTSSTHSKDEKTPKTLAKIFTLKTGQSVQKILTMKQTHGFQHQFADHFFDPSISCDSVSTKTAKTLLTVYHADCQPALFFDPVQNVIAAVHCGFRGSVQNIYAKTIKSLHTHYGCNPKNILVGIGPSLGPKHAEYINHAVELPKFVPYDGKNHFDFWEISYNQLIQAGIQSNHIEIARLCTFENHTLFHSYRRDKTTLGNITCIGFGEQLTN